MKIHTAFQGILVTSTLAFVCAMGSNLNAQVPPVYQPEPPIPLKTILVSRIQQEDPETELPGATGEPGTVAPLRSETQTGRYPYLITRPADRDWIRSMPIENRPNRVFHVYGNAVRAGMLPHGPLGRAIFGN